MRGDLLEMLTKIDSGNNALLEASLSTQDQLQTMTGLLRHLIGLIEPNNSGQDGPTVDELLARMIAQQTAIIELSKQAAAGVTRIETHLLEFREKRPAVLNFRKIAAGCREQLVRAYFTRMSPNPAAIKPSTWPGASSNPGAG